MALACAGVSFVYDGAGETVPALDDVTFGLPAGGSLALLGASGSGKTTLLQLLRGLDPPAEGSVRLDGAAPDDPGYAALQRCVGLVFQAPELQLFAATVHEDAAFGPTRLGWAQDEVDAAVADALALVGLPAEEFAGRHPFALSGGEQRRLALAGVLAMGPRLLLLDEPFVSLDPATRRDLAAILLRLKATGVTIVLATHDIDLAWALCDGLLLLREGRVVASGAWDFGDGRSAFLAEDRLREPFLVQLWRRLGRDPASAPRTAGEAAGLLA